MRWVVFSNVYVSFCGAALTTASYALLGHEPRLSPIAALVFCCTLVIYNLDRLVEPTPGDSPQERWVEQHREALWALTLTASVIALGLLPFLSTAVIVSLLPAGLIALGYCLPVLPFRGRWRRLKALPGAKLLLIAMIWTYATAALPMLELGVSLDATTLPVLIARLLFLSAVALPFDLPDMQRDSQSGITTLPTLLGVRNTRMIAIGLALGAMGAGVLNPWPAAGAVLLSSGVAVCLLLPLREDRGVGYFMVALDGMLLLQAGALWLFATT